MKPSKINSADFFTFFMWFSASEITIFKLSKSASSWRTYNTSDECFPRSERDFRQWKLFSSVEKSVLISTSRRISPFQFRNISGNIRIDEFAHSKDFHLVARGSQQSENEMKKQRNPRISLKSSLRYSLLTCLSVPRIWLRLLYNSPPPFFTLQNLPCSVRWRILEDEI